MIYATSCFEIIESILIFTLRICIRILFSGMYTLETMGGIVSFDRQRFICKWFPALVREDEFPLKTYVL